MRAWPAQAVRNTGTRDRTLRGYGGVELLNADDEAVDVRYAFGSVGRLDPSAWFAR